MKNHHHLKIGLVACVAGLFVAMQVSAANLAAASGVLSEVAVISTQSSLALATAAGTGDIAAIADAQKRADAVDSAMAEAQEAYSAMERAVAGGDEDAAAAAADDLEAARQKAEDALTGDVPEPTPKSLKEEWKESTTNTGGGPGDGYDPPNIYHVPSQSAGLQSLSASMSSIVSSSGGGSTADSNSYGDNDFGDGDATPE